MGSPRSPRAAKSNTCLSAGRLPSALAAAGTISLPGICRTRESPNPKRFGLGLLRASTTKGTPSALRARIAPRRAATCTASDVFICQTAS